MRTGLEFPVQMQWDMVPLLGGLIRITCARMRREKCYFLHLSHLFDQFSKSEQSHINTYALLSNKPISKTSMVLL